MIVSGLTGSIELTSGALIIRHRTLMGLVGLGLQGERKIFLSEITSIQLKRAGIFTVGYISFATRGGDGHPHGLTGAPKDPLSVTFREMSKNREFSAFKEAAEDAIRRAREPTANTGFSVADELEKLAGLRSQNVITEAEFDQQKRKLLG